MSAIEGVSAGSKTSEGIVELVPDKVYALQNPFALDGRISSYPDSARGYSVSNVYLVKEETGAYILDTGFAAHEGRILGQLGSLLDTTTPISLVPLRINEYMSVGNGIAIADNFNVIHCYSPQPNAADWLEFDLPESGKAGRDLPTTVLRGRLDLAVGTKGERPLVGFTAPLRLINTTWVYDPTTRTLFSSDMFTHVWQKTADGPWLIDDDDGVTTTDFVRSFLLNTRYWWLEGATTETLRQGVADVFEQCDIETIAPGYGAILRGRSLVEKQFAVLDQVLRDLDRSVVKPDYVPRGLER